MNKQIFFIILAFITLFIWNEYQISIMYNNIKKVRKEAWFNSHEISDMDIRDIKSCLKYLEKRINSYHGVDPHRPMGYKFGRIKKSKKDPLLEYLIDKSL